MEDVPVQPGYTQADMIREELNFDIDPNDPLTKAALSEHPENEWMDILGNGQLRKRILTKGEAGTRPQKTDICTLKIIGKLEDGTIVDEFEEAVIQLGDVEIVQGLDLAVALMDVGEVAEIEVASRFAYGNVGKAPLIPPGATITYTVTLIKVDLEKDVETLDVNERKRIGNLKRERGNWWFIRDEPELAIQCYRRALTFLAPTSTSVDDKEESISDAELQKLLEDKMKIYNNLAAAQIKTQAYSAALKSVENVLSCQPNNVKALYRKGKILHHQGEYSLAYTTLLQAAKLEPETKCIQQELQALKEKNAKDMQQQKNLYRKMLGTNKSTNGSIKKYSSQENEKNTKSTKLMWSLLGGATAAMIGVLVYRFSS